MPLSEPARPPLSWCLRVRGLRTLVLTPCSFPTLRFLWSTVYFLCLSEAPSGRQWGSVRGCSDRLATWRALSRTEASPSADKEPSFPVGPLDTEEKWGFLPTSCLVSCLGSLTARRPGRQCREHTWSAVTWHLHLLLAQPFTSWGVMGKGFPHSWPQFPPLVPS